MLIVSLKRSYHVFLLPFKPSIAVVVCVLTIIISLTSLLLFYIKLCNDGITDDRGKNSASWMVVSFTERKNFGIDWSMVESLPNFKFRVLRGQKEGLNCAVCLNKFKVAKVLRLLSKCKHAFHVECVDSWLDVHSMCPLCCYCMDPEDIFLVEEAKPFHQSHQQQNNDQGRVCLNLDLEKQGIVKSRQRHLFVRGGGRRNNRGVATESEVDDVI